MFHGVVLGPVFLAWSDLGLTLGLLALVIPLGWLYGRRLARQGLDLNSAFEKGPRSWVLLLGFLGICISIGLIYRMPTLFSPAVMGWLEPASWLTAKSGAVFLAAMAVPLGGQQRKQVLTIAALGGFCILALLGLQGWLLRPVSPSEIFVRKARDGSILQSTSVTCTAVALANALRMFGIEATEAETARILGTRESGTTQLQLLNGVRAYGLSAHYVSVRPEHLVRMNRPAIVSIDLQVILHSILVYGHDTKGNLLIIDPMAGKGKLTPKQYLGKLKTSEGVVLTERPLPEVNPESPRFLIEQAQRILHREGYLKTVNGLFDLAMVEALKGFQAHWQLPVKGVMDAPTWLLLTGPDQPGRA